MDRAVLKKSEESVIDREITHLIAKKVLGTATGEDLRRLEEITRRRSQLMRDIEPPVRRYG